MPKKRVKPDNLVVIEPLPSRPTRVKVGPFDYRIISESAMDGEREGRYGYHHFGSLQIGMQSDLPLQQQAHILHHELLHACWAVADLEDQEQEEKAVTSLARLMNAVWRDNPSLFRWFNFAIHTAD